MARLFLCANCGRDTLTRPCGCGGVTPQYVFDFMELPDDRPAWLKEMEDNFKRPPDP